jgi:Tfp pilus assembly protein PilP
MTRNFRSIVIALAMVALAGPLWAQTPPPQPAPETAPRPPSSLPSPPPNYVYSADGRRDPFVNLLNRGTDALGTQGKRLEGVAGLQVAEFAVRGIVQSRGGWTAMVAGPDGKMHTLRAGDKLLDGTVREVTAQYVVILQEVKDPLSLEKQREVRKFLRGGDEVK